MLTASSEHLAPFLAGEDRESGIELNIAPERANGQVCPRTKDDDFLIIEDYRSYLTKPPLYRPSFLAAISLHA